MAQFSVDIQKTVNGIYWTNRYLVQATDLAAASAVAADIADQEQLVHATWITMDKFRVSTVTEGDDVYVVVPIGEPGSRETTGGSLPLFNVARVDFAATSGRPSRKYLRVGITADDVGSTAIGVMDDALLTVMQAYGDALVAMPEFEDPQGQTFTLAVAYKPIAMHQLRRGSRRVITPVI